MIIKLGKNLAIYSIYLLSHIFYFLNRSNNIILIFHGVTKDPNTINSEIHMNINLFENLIKSLKKKYTIISLQKLVDCIKNKKKFPKHSLVITFDDGYQNIYTNAYPILKKYNISATIFLTTGFINAKKIIWYDQVKYCIYKTKINYFKLNSKKYYIKNKHSKKIAIKKIIENLKRIKPSEREIILNDLFKKLNVKIIPKPKEDYYFLTWKQVKEMSKNGNIIFGAHTVNHEILTNISNEEIEKEIINSKKEIEKRINKPVNFFAYPNGTKKDFDKYCIKILQYADFLCALSTIKGINNKKSNLFMLKRITFDSINCFFVGLLTINLDIIKKFFFFKN